MAKIMLCGALVLASVSQLFSQECAEFIQETPQPICMGDTLQLTTVFTENLHSLTFDGVDDRVEIGYTDTLNVVGKDFSISAWFMTSSQSGRQNILSMPSSTWASHGAYCLYVEDGWLRFTIRETLEAPWYAHLITEQFSLGEWHHVLATADQTNGIMKLYLDGQLIGTKDDWSGSMYQDAQEPLMIGVQYKEDYPGQYFAHFDGSIDNVALYEGVIGESELSDIYSCPISLSDADGLIAKWEFLEGSGNETMSSNATVANGFLIGGPSFSNSVPYGGGPLLYSWSTGHSGTELSWEVDQEGPVTLAITDSEGNIFTDVYELQAAGTPTEFIQYTVCMGDDFTAPNGVVLSNIVQQEVVSEEWVDIHGCDSVIKHIVTPDELNVTITLSETTFTVNEAADTYDWYHCRPDPIFVEQVTDPVYIATQGGEYMVIVTRGGCIDSSACLALAYPTFGLTGEDYFMLDYNFEADVQMKIIEQNEHTIYPNPSNGPVTISADYHFDGLKVTDITGKVIRQESFLETSVFEINWPAEVKGVFIVQIHADGQWKGSQRMVRY